jgi:hypothetical protein
VWQPVPTYRCDPRADLFSADDQFGPAYAKYGYPVVAEYARQERFGPDFMWCAEIQKGITEPLYVDKVHYSAKLSKMLAGCIAGFERHGVSGRSVCCRQPAEKPRLLLSHKTAVGRRGKRRPLLKSCSNSRSFAKHHGSPWTFPGKGEEKENRGVWNDDPRPVVLAGWLLLGLPKGLGDKRRQHSCESFTPSRRRPTGKRVVER